MIWGEGRRIDETRELTLLTWGTDCLSRSSPKLCNAQFHVNAKLLNGRGGGADLSHNALDEPRVMLNVAQALAAGRGLVLLRGLVKKIEEGELKVISVYCSKGRHRSVSLAVLLSMVYYTSSTVRHLTLS